MSAKYTLQDYHASWRQLASTNDNDNSFEELANSLKHPAAARYGRRQNSSAPPSTQAAKPAKRRVSKADELRRQHVQRMRQLYGFGDPDSPPKTNLCDNRSTSSRQCSPRPSRPVTSVLSDIAEWQVHQGGDPGASVTLPRDIIRRIANGELDPSSSSPPRTARSAFSRNSPVRSSMDLRGSHDLRGSLELRSSHDLRNSTELRTSQEKPGPHWSSSVWNRTSGTASRSHRGTPSGTGGNVDDLLDSEVDDLIAWTQSLSANDFV